MLSPSNWLLYIYSFCIYARASVHPRVSIASRVMVAAVADAARGGRLVVPVVPVNTREQSTIISKARVNRHSRRDPVLTSHFLIAHTITNIYVLTTFVTRVCVLFFFFFGFPFWFCFFFWIPRCIYFNIDFTDWPMLYFGQSDNFKPFDCGSDIFFFFERNAWYRSLKLFIFTISFPSRDKRIYRS